MAKKWRGQLAVLEMSGGSLPTDPFGVLQEVTVSPDQNVEELRGAGSTKWVDLQKTEIAFEISGSAMAWDMDTWDRAVDFDDAASEVDPGPDVPTFSATVTLEAADGSTKEITFGDCYFDPPPELSGGSDEWIGMDISLRAQDITGISNTDASA